jgi:hypothetical protein
MRSGVIAGSLPHQTRHPPFSPILTVQSHHQTSPTKMDKQTPHKKIHPRGSIWFW